MSHITTIQTEFYDWEILLETIRELTPMVVPRGFSPVNQKLELRLKGSDEPVICFPKRPRIRPFASKGW